MKPQAKTRPAPSGGNRTAARDWLRALETTAQIAARPTRTLADAIEDMGDTRGEAPALLSSGERLDYGALSACINRYARWALEQHVAVQRLTELMHNWVLPGPSHVAFVGTVGARAFSKALRQDDCPAAARLGRRVHARRSIKPGSHPP